MQGSKTSLSLHSFTAALVIFKLISKLELMQNLHGSIGSFNKVDFVYKLIWLGRGQREVTLVKWLVVLICVGLCISEVAKQDEWVMINRTFRTVFTSQTPSCFLFRSTELRNMVMLADNSLFPYYQCLCLWWSLTSNVINIPSPYSQSFISLCS